MVLITNVYNKGKADGGITSGEIIKSGSGTRNYGTNPYYIDITITLTASDISGYKYLLFFFGNGSGANYQGDALFQNISISVGTSVAITTFGASITGLHSDDWGNFNYRPYLIYSIKAGTISFRTRGFYMWVVYGFK